MKYTIFFVVLIGIIFGAMYLLDNKVSENIKSFSKKNLMTKNEIEFFNRLTEALPEYYIFPQVAMASILQVKKSNDGNKSYGLRNRFSHKIIDYLVCDADLNIVAIIELDDKTHSQQKDSDRDAMTKQAGYITIRWQSKNKPDIQSIRKEFGLS